MGKTFYSWDRCCCILCIFFLTLCSGCMPGQSTKESKIVVWHWMTDRKEAFNELAEKYKAETGIDVEFKLFFPPDIYSQKVIAAARAGNLPHIFGILGEKKTLASFIRAGHIIALTPSMEENNAEWRERFYPETLRIVEFSDANVHQVPKGIYGVPIDTTVMQFVYNKTLLTKAGLNPKEHPQSFNEFITVAKTAKDRTNTVGFICGWGEGWLLNALATEWAINSMGEEKFLNTIEGAVPYTDQDWIKVFSFFKTLRDSGILVSNIATMTNKESEDAFARNKAVFSFNGSWAVNVYRQLNPALDYAFFSLPYVSAKNPVKVWGGAGSSFMVSARSARRDEAIRFLNWLTQKEQQEYLIRQTNNLPSIKGCEQSLPPVLKSLMGTFDKLTHPDIWPRNEDSRVVEVINRGLQQIVMGLKSPQEVAREIQSKKEKISR